jgi:SAM-dependent methyltransferase
MTVVEMQKPLQASAADACSACTAENPQPRLAVGAELGEDGLIPTTDAYGTALDDIVECPRCGHRQLSRMPSDRRLLALYEDAETEDYVEEEAGQRATARRTLELIERHVPVGRILDLGCWVGYLLAEARARGWEVTGVEPSAWAAAYARDELGLPVVQADLFSADVPAGAFDAIVLGDVIEHLTDPAAALEHIAGLLAADGVLFMALPDAGSTLARRMGARWWSVIPTHVQYFTRDSMRTLLRRMGYETLHVGTAPKTFRARYYLGRLGGYSPRAADLLVRAAARAGVADRLWTPDFRDRMAVVARRPRRQPESSAAPASVVA